MKLDPFERRILASHNIEKMGSRSHLFYSITAEDEDFEDMIEWCRDNLSSEIWLLRAYGTAFTMEFDDENDAVLARMRFPGHYFIEYDMSGTMIL